MAFIDTQNKNNIQSLLTRYVRQSLASILVSSVDWTIHYTPTQCLMKLENLAGCHKTCAELLKLGRCTELNDRCFKFTMIDRRDRYWVISIYYIQRTNFLIYTFKKMYHLYARNLISESSYTFKNQRRGIYPVASLSHP